MGRKSISNDALLLMARWIGLLTLFTTIISYSYFSNLVEKDFYDDVKGYIAGRSDRENILFEDAAKNHQTILQDFTQKYRQCLLQPEKSVRRFDQLVQLRADNTFRNRDPHFDGTQSPGVFMGPQKGLNTAKKCRIVVAYDITERFGLPYHKQFRDTYFTFTENAMVLYWPEQPTWSLRVKSSMNVNEEEYSYVASPSANPSKKTKWTGVFYDKVSEDATAMVTASTPIYIDGEYLGSVHHDVSVNEVFDRTLSERLSGADNYYIVRNDGRLILHPDYFDQIRANHGNFDISGSQNQILKDQFQQILKSSGNYSLIDSPAAKDYLVVAKISGPDWYLVTVYPKSTLQALAAKNTAFILVVGVFSLLVQLTILHFILKKRIQRPLLQLNQATQKIANGVDIHLSVEREDELGQLAASFNNMSAAIKDRDQRLENHAQNLEKLVEERTLELDRQKSLNIQASKMSSLGEMAGGIAHEINTPLATIHLLASQMKRQIQEDIPDLDHITGQLQKIEATTERAAKIVRGLRAFARDGGSDPLEPASAINIVDQTIALCTEQLRRYNIDLEITTTDKSLLILCRPVQISQVLLNLITNAKDAIKNLPEKWIKIQISETSGQVEFRITDSGSGILKENHEKIFLPFYTTKGIGSATGLGLSISLGIIQSHQGDLVIDHTSHNTCFIVKIPRAEAMKQAS